MRNMAMDMLKRSKEIIRKEGLLVFAQKSLKYLAQKVNRYIIRYVGGVVPNRPDLVIFGAHRGESYRGNPQAVYEHILDNDYELTPIWITRSSQVYDRLKNENKPVVHMNSIRSLQTLFRANIGLFTHQTSDLSPTGRMGIPSSLNLIYCQHGNPIKGDPEANPDKRTHKKKRNEQVEYVLTTSEFQINQRLKTRPLSEDDFAITGYPRNDKIFSNPEIDFANNYSHIVMYAPTHRKTESLEMKFFPFEDFNPQKLFQKLEEHDILLLIRPHPDVTRGTHVGDEYESLRHFLNSLGGGAEVFTRKAVGRN
ncbi:CDP-glycerol glycerophosphotransferase family protein [Salinarchaeum sp. IM2453]|uniref:CDP-glycerol glycerophosphotransferase family protein n=1 Tax=Salinarchaeum sp. IM2453 TaxID=2862870 RepID=UPI001C83103E|nr:CDP-glycerol glycerophosphotransferase family protein [Salinarchaeum sp. IM2453]QZA89097.1 CDP-glycerol glycerophosphotransferase family protein [Salinarchaeum sp. IM2453]